MRATAAVAVQQAVQVITHIALLIFFSVAAGASADLSHFVPKLTLLYLIGGVALGVIGAFLFVPKLRHWLETAVRPKINEVGVETLFGEALISEKSLDEVILSYLAGEGEQS